NAATMQSVVLGHEIKAQTAAAFGRLADRTGRKRGVRDSSKTRYSHVLELLIEQLNHFGEMAGRERIFDAGTGSFGQHQAARPERCSQDGVTHNAAEKDIEEPCVSAPTILGKDRGRKQHAVVRSAVGIVKSAGIG